MQESSTLCQLRQKTLSGGNVSRNVEGVYFFGLREVDKSVFSVAEKSDWVKRASEISTIRTVF